ncbi:hypothetical protein GS398_08700 [Pedobacter sp. HMF7056]|uniref:DUF3575 domain-containing protein n=1 Tax=Hufsiella ginkgonis TaxID=2695274 RepID=A0A7K1XX41_9SPHI|nr:hypothetical protein [Hufsiella ginkgonis]
MLLILLAFPFTVKSQFLKTVAPDAVIAQYAGSIGFGSIGGTYDLWKGKGTADLLYGFVPKSKGGSLHIATAKFSYRPFRIRIGETATIYPANPGAFFSYHFGKEFNFSWSSEQYPKGYYWWSPAFRPHLSLSNEIRFHSGKTPASHRIREVSVYNEFNTNDLYLVSWAKNRESISVFDAVKMGFGVRVYF